jgi:6,7-dimethyl-8-ribityllumazine synthase
MRIAIVYSSFNENVTQGLLNGATTYLTESKIPLRKEDIFKAPGAFEIPLIAKHLAKTKRYDGVICLGCVIKGDTAHFEFISLGTTSGIMQAMLETEIPITFGVLTTYTDDQAILRSRENGENKGIEAAKACLEAISLLKRIKTEG